MFEIFFFVFSTWNSCTNVPWALSFFLSLYLHTGKRRSANKFKSEPEEVTHPPIFPTRPSLVPHITRPTKPVGLDPFFIRTTKKPEIPEILTPEEPNVLPTARSPPNLLPTVDPFPTEDPFPDDPFDTEDPFPDDRPKLRFPTASPPNLLPTVHTTEKPEAIPWTRPTHSPADHTGSPRQFPGVGPDEEG